MAIELATAYVSIVPDTRNIDSLLQKAFKGAGKSATITPTINAKGMEQAGASASQSFHRSFQANANSQAQRVGQNVGTILGKGISVGVAGAVGAIGYTLTKGFQRLERIDNAAFKLKALGNSAADVDKIMKSATDAVKGTAFALDDAATAAASAVAAGVKPGEQLTKYLGNIGDAAAVAGTSFDDMARIFNKVQANGKAYTDDLNMLQDRGVPVMKLLQDQYGVTADELRKMVEDGKVSATDFETALSGKIGGAAQKMGQSFSGAVDNAQTAVARLGANFLASIFGGSSTNALAGPAEAVTALTEKLDMANAWVTSNGPQIRAFFSDIKNVVSDVAGAIRGIVTVLDGMGISIGDVVIAFAAWKTISGIAAATTAIQGVGNALGLLPGKADAAGRGIGAGLAKVAVPAWLAFLVYNQGKNIFDNATAGDAKFPGQSTPTDPTGSKGMQNRTTGGTVMGIPSYANDKAFQSNHDESIYGGPGAQRDRKGAGYTGDFFGSSATGVGSFSNASSTVSDTGGSVLPGTQGLIDRYKSFGLSDIGGYRQPDGYNEHSSGKAADVMIPGWDTPGGSTKGMQVVQDALAQNGVQYVIWQQKTWYPDGSSKAMEDRGSPTQNHMDHVHIKTYDQGGWWPSGTLGVNKGKDEYVLTPEQLEEMRKQGIDPATVHHGTGQGAPPGPAPQNMPEQMEQPELNDAGRQEGYIPAGAGYSGKTGGGLAGSFIGMGAEAVKGLIDSAASGASMGADMFAPGSGMAIQMGAAIAKRGVDYAAELGSIGIGALSEIFMPFGAPRWLSDVDATSFIPQQSMTPALTTTSEQAVNDLQNPEQLAPGGGPVPPQGPQPPGGLDVLSRATQDAADTLAPPPTPPMVNVENITAADSDAVGESIAKGQRLAMMRFAGRP